jgi:hypothetical protein
MEVSGYIRLDGSDPCAGAGPLQPGRMTSWNVTSHRIGAAQLDRRLGAHNLEEHLGT